MANREQEADQGGPEGGQGVHGRDERAGARQPQRFDPARAGRLDNPERLEYLPPERIFDLLDAPPGARVVDFGAGTGLFSLLLARSRPDLQITALDEQPRMLELLRARLADGTVANVAPLHTDGIESLAGRVDRVLAINVLHELGDAALHTMVGLLRPGGSVLVVDWNAAVERRVGPPRDHVYAPAEARARLERAGLRVREAPALPYHYVLVGERAGEG